MRTLAVILALTLAVGVGMGQTWRLKPGGYITGYTLAVDTGSIPAHREHSAIIRLAQLWREYGDSCYADSSACGNFMIDLRGRLRPCHYIHRSPTFEGFMDFITRRTR